MIKKYSLSITLRLLQANAAQPPDTVTWLQHQLSVGVSLRHQAMTEETSDAKLCCLPVFVAASTHASASSLNFTASGRSQIAELYVPRLSLVRLHLKSVCQSGCGRVGLPQMDMSRQHAQDGHVLSCCCMWGEHTCFPLLHSLTHHAKSQMCTN